MKNFLSVILFFAVIFIGFSGKLSAQKMLFFRAKSDFSIVIPNRATDLEILSANELQKYIKRCSGAELPIITEKQYSEKQAAIFVGKTDYAQVQSAAISQLKNDGFFIYSDSNNLIIYGKEKKGTLYGVYDFLETFLGFRLYTPDNLYVTDKAFFHLPDTLIIRNPSFRYREVLYYYPNQSQLYADWHKLHNRNDLAQDWGMFVHTFRHLIPVEKYFEEHPEWFSEINGRRIKDGQLCLSNPDVLEELCRNLAMEMEKKPEATYWSVSNNDNMNNCQCAQCHRLDSLYGAPSGTLLYFINQVAARFPDKQISTLAYQYTRKAPERWIVPEPNVNIMFCSIECGRQESIATAIDEEEFRSDMYGWKRLTDNLFVWDYIVQFRNMLNPFPNLHVLQPNLQYFRDNKVEMMFEQGTGAQNKTAWMEIRTYLTAKLLWNVDADVDSIFAEFCQGYYGAASPYISEFYREMHQSLIASKKGLEIYGYPIDGKEGYLSPTQIGKYQKLIAQAYAVAGCDSTLVDKIRYLELSLDFAVLELAMSNISPELSFFIYKNGEKCVSQEMMTKAENFVADCHRFGINNLEEMGYTPEKFFANIKNFIAKSTLPNLAQNRKVTLKTQFSPTYDAGGAQSLTDGIVGTLDYHFNWLGFEGKHLDAIVDLESEKVINQISIDFFFYPLSWIYAPEKVIFYISRNGKRWKKVSERQYENPQILAKANIVNFSSEELTNKKARYIRVKATSPLVNPEWHRGYGLPCWIFTDEIIVR